MDHKAKNYFNIYSAWRSVDDHVPISGVMGLDFINGSRYENRVLIEILNDKNGTLVKSDYATLNVTDGSFAYDFPLWVDDTIYSDPPDNYYRVKATYGPYQHDWSFVLTPGQPSGIAPFDNKLTVPTNVTIGQQIEIEIGVENYAEVPLKEWPFVTVLEVRDSLGLTVYLGWQSGSLISGCNTEMGFSWAAEKEGEYEVRTFAISDFQNPGVLSWISSTEILVTRAG